MSSADTIAVVGLGCVYPGAPDVETFWDNIVAGRSAIIDAPADRIDPRFFAGPAGRPDQLTTTRGGFVQGDALRFEPGRFGIMPITVLDAEPDQMMALKTAAAAVDDAGGLDHVAHDRIGVILGRGAYLTPALARLDQRVRTSHQLVETLHTLLPELDEDRLTAVREAFTDQLGELRPESAIGLVPNLAASRIANRFDFGGPAYTVDAACASSLIAVDAAITELTSGRCDAVLAGGVHHCHDVTLWSVFSQLGALSPSGEIRPFSRDADGVLVSEGTGILVLERLADARRLDHRVYATLRGAGVASDGRHSSLMSPRVDGQVLALERAYRVAGVDPATVGLVEGHGTATPAGDRAELETLRSVFGKYDPVDGPRSTLGSVKSNIGHAMPAAGAAGLIKSVLAVHHGVLPPTLHGDDPHPALADTRFRLLDQPEPWSDRPGPRRSGVNAFGFGGINAHVIVEEHGSASSRTRTVPPPSATTTVPARAEDHRFRFDAILLQGGDATDLAAQLATLSPESSDDRPRLPSGGGPARLAIVEPTPKRLELAARVLAKGQPWRGRNDVWFEPSGLVTTGGRVAFLLPGIEPTFDVELGDIAAWFGLDVPDLPASATGIERQGRQIFDAGRLLHQALTALGIAPDDIAGHSLGEWTGAFTAELIPADEADGFLGGLRPGSLEVPGVVFVALGGGADVAGEVIAGLDGVVVSHDNCPHQSVICGPEESMAEAARRLAARKVLAQELPFRSGFHTPFFEPYLDIVRHHWERMPLQAPRIPLWSATTCERYPTEAVAVRRLAADHLVKPVRFRELIGRLHDDGVRVFVQLGVGSLVAFADDTLKDRAQLSISAASSARPGLDQLARVAAALWVEGVDVRLEQLLTPVGTGLPAPEREPRLGPTVQLALGSPLVDLPASLSLGVAPGDASARSAPKASTNGVGGNRTSPVLRAELDALLAETLGATQSITDALASAAPRRPAARGRDRTARAEPPATSTDARPAGQPAVPMSEEVLTIDVETFPWLVDHCFYRQPVGWADLSDRFPVLPMTTMVELLGQAASRLAPDLTVARIENVRAMRWLPGAPPTRAVLTAKRVGTYQVEAAIEGYARATVHLAPSAPPAPAPSAAPLRNPRPSPVGPGPLYTDHWMFHGPAFQGVRSIAALGDDGIDGTIESLPTPGAWLDNAGQLYGWWLMATAESEFLALPQSIERIEFFGSQPPIGEPVATTVRIVDLGPRTMRADLELVWNGSVTVRITGWVDRRFDSDPPLWLMLREPEDHLLASPTASGYLAVEERWGDSASRELMARRYLDASEREVYEALNPRQQRLWLLGRIAAKDAVRHALGSEGHRGLFPVEVPLVDDGDHAVLVVGGPAAGRRVAVATGPWVGVAAVGLARVWVESVDDRDRAAARSRLDQQVAGQAAPNSTVVTEVLSSPIHLHAGAPDDTPNLDTSILDDDADAETTAGTIGPADQKEYLVAFAQPA
ncbi:MAG TPA: beta-ketoacyl synthase N-terminal-like domain-containing protein [Acidimicrobiales bacterium]|nr:beta-ketoacyl synthase N-terminal-like domain-containing protein [Acidimicrobiales bacterium]